MNCPHCGEPLNINIDLTPDEIIDTVCEYFKTSREAISKRARYRGLCYPRQLCYFLIRKYNPRLSQRAIGDYFKQHHATVIHSITTINNLMFTDMEIKDQVEEINNLLISSVA